MEEIKVGEYVRTEEGNIGKLIAIRVEDKEYLEGYIYNIHIHKNLYMNLKNKDIIKHSPNIIDLIEEGDYVNGEPVEKIEIGLDWGLEITTTTEYFNNEEDIQNIVTKEQFNQIKYEV